MGPWAWRTYWQAQAAVRKAMKEDIEQESAAEEDPDNKYKNEHGDGSGDEGKNSRGRGRGRGRGRSRAPKKAPKGKASGSKPEQKREQKEPSQEASIEVPKVDLASPPPPQTAAAKPVERDTSRENIDKFFAEHPGALPADHALAKSRPKAEHTSTPPDTASTTTAERAEAKQFKKDVEKEEREAKTPTKTPPRGVDEVGSLTPQSENVKPEPRRKLQSVPTSVRRLSQKVPQPRRHKKGSGLPRRGEERQKRKDLTRSTTRIPGMFGCFGIHGLVT